MTKLSPQVVLNAYCQGVFPMADEDGTIYWYDPDPRAILPLEGLHVPRRLARTVRQGPFEIRIDTAFPEVIAQCAQTAPNRETTWINDELIELYTQLHRAGFVHSVEAWQGERLAGGLYGVAIRGLFAGESMFSQGRDASKVALVHLVERLKRGGFTLLDTQFSTPHLGRFGVIEISRTEYQARLAAALTVEAVF